MYFIELTTLEDQRVCVNLDNVCEMRESSRITTLWFNTTDDGSQVSLKIKEPVDFILRLLPGR